MIESLTVNGRASKSKSTFQMGYAIGINIKVQPDKIWSLLTKAKDFPRWNSTVKNIDGNISLGEKIQLRATIAPERIFKLRVSEFVPNQKMVWRDGSAPMFQGVRTYVLKVKNDGSTDFLMEEIFSGLMLPMIVKSLPDFAATFEQYAADLKREAEGSS
jgi:hypothetical protein